MSEKKTDIENREEILFIYDAKDCDPNGDPFTGEPRYDEAVQKVMVSDVRIKRYIRDYIDQHYSDENDDSIPNNDKNKIVFYSSLGETQTVGARRDSLADIVEKNNEDDIKQTFIDIRLFGCVLAEKGENINLTGAVQFKNLNRSLNKVELEIFQNTSVMKSKEEHEQGAIATASIVPYALISIMGYVNPKTAESNLTTKKDIKLMLKSLWDQVNIVNTRSKTGQTSRLLIVLEYKDAISKISDFENIVKLKEEEKNNLNYRSFEEIEKDIDYGNFLERMKDNENIIYKIKYHVDKSIESRNTTEFIENLKGLASETDIAVEEIDFTNI
jgi:CRISPR-associated protein Csh2